MRRLYAEGHRVELMSPLDLADDDWVAVVSNMGAPLVGQERLADSRNIARAVEIQEDLLGEKFRAVMSLEIGGGNGIQPLMAAAHLGLPVVDADTMGRAYPEAQMTSVAVGDLRPYPCVLYDPRGIEAVVTKVPSWKWMERASRKICVEMGSIASTCKAPRTGAEVKEWGIHFTVSKAIGIGRRVRDAQRRHEDPVAAILDEGRGKLLFRGKVVDVARRTTEGFLRGRAIIEGLDEDRGIAARDRVSERMGRGVARRGADRDVARSDLRPRHRLGRGLWHRDDRLWPAGHRSSPSRAPPVFPDAARASSMSARRAFGYDLDFRSVFAEGDLGRMRADRHRCRRHQYRRGAARRRARRACGQDPDDRGCYRRHRRRAGWLGRHPRSTRGAIDGVVIGTTHFVNAVVQRRDLARVAAVRIGLPAGASLPPFCDWPEDLAALGPRRGVHARRRARL